MRKDGRKDKLAIKDTEFFFKMNLLEVRHTSYRFQVFRNEVIQLNSHRDFIKIIYILDGSNRCNLSRMAYHYSNNYVNYKIL